jgi:PAS domain S-box-containing protein
LQLPLTTHQTTTDAMNKYKTEELAEALFEEAGDALFLFDPDTDQLLNANSTAQRLTGFSRPELLGMPATYLFRSGTKGGLTRLKHATQKTGFFHSQEGFFLRNQQDGVWVPVNLTVSRLHVRPKTLGLITARDIREQHETHAQLKRMEAELRRVLASVSDCLWSAEVDAKGQWHYRYVSPVVAKITGQPPEYFLAGIQRWWSILHPEDRPRWEKALVRLRAGQSSQEEYRVLWPDGSLHWIRDSVMVSRGAEGQGLRLDGIVTDITERKQADAALREGEERLARIVETNADGITLVDLEGRITFANAAAEKIFGLPRDEILKLSFKDRPWKIAGLNGKPPTDEEFAFSQVLRSGRPVYGAERAIRRPDGEWAIVSINAAALRDAAGTVVGMVASLSDITERKRAEMLLQRRADEQEALSRVSGLLLQVESEQALYTEMPAILGKVFLFEVVSIELHDEATGDMVFRGSVGIPASGSSPLRVPASELISGTVLKSGRGTVVYDAQNCADLKNGALRQLGVTTVVCLPMTAQKRVIGTLVLATPRQRRLPTSLIDTLQTIADGIAQTIERKRTEEALRATNATLGALIQASPLAIVTLDPAGTVRSWNPAAERLFGWQAHEVVGRPSALIGPDQQAESRALHERVARGETLAGVEVRRRKRDGSLVDLSLSLAPLYDAQGGLSGLVTMMADVTERKRSEEALREREARLQLLVTQMPAVVWTTDAALRITSAVGAGLSALDVQPDGGAGASLAELLQSRGTEFLSPAAHRRALAGEALGYELEWCGRFFQCHLEPLRAADDRVTGCIGVGIDITERRGLEEQLRQAQKMEAIGRLAGGVAHDFNNLLTAILGNTSLVLANLPAADANRELLQANEKAARRAAELTQQLLGFSRQTMLRLEPTNLHNAIHDTVKILRRTIDPRITVEVRSAPVLRQVRADPGQMSQVLMNLCLNARDAMPNGGRLLVETEPVVLDEEASRRHLDARPGEFVRLSVSDTGHGIPPDIRSRIFDPFFTTKEPGKGTGLGLAMVFGIIKQHQGWIECASEVGQGTRFDIYLPRAGEEAVPPAPAPATRSASGRGTETILLADDEAMIRNLARAVLEQHGYQVLLAADGLEAVETYRRERHRIALVILDLTMPRLSGRDALRQLLQIDPQVRVLLASGYSAEHLSELEEDQIAGFIGKPYRVDELAKTVRATLDRAKAEAVAR